MSSYGTLGMNTASGMNPPSRFHFSAEVREIDNGYIVRIVDSTGMTEHAFLLGRAVNMPELISQRLLMALPDTVYDGVNSG